MGMRDAARSLMDPNQASGYLPGGAQGSAANYQPQASHVNENDGMGEYTTPIGRVVGTIAGTYFGGPLGGQIGGQIGGKLGGMAGKAASSKGMSWGEVAEEGKPDMSKLTGLKDIYGGGASGAASGAFEGGSDAGLGELTELGAAVV